MLKPYSGDRPARQLFNLMVRARMGEHSFENVTEALEGSGLLDLMYPQYRMLLRCMAEMADACVGREFPASHTQIAKRSGGDRHGSMTPELVAEMVFDFIRLGIVEVVSAAWSCNLSNGDRKERVETNLGGRTNNVSFRQL